jgi:hypothetical protein
MVDGDPVQVSARRLMACGREVAFARSVFEQVAVEQEPAAVDAQRDAMRRWQAAEADEREARCRLAELLDVEVAELIVTADEVLYVGIQDVDRPRHRRGTMPPEYTIYRCLPGVDL